jgi:hypothetical protein
MQKKNTTVKYVLNQCAQLDTDNNLFINSSHVIITRNNIQHCYYLPEKCFTSTISIFSAEMFNSLEEKLTLSFHEITTVRFFRL